MDKEDDKWLSIAEKKAKLPKLGGSLWHAYRRKSAIEQKHREFGRLGIKIGQEFRLEFVGFPSYDLVPPMAPPASSPNLLMPR